MELCEVERAEIDVALPHRWRSLSEEALHAERRDAARRKMRRRACADDMRRDALPLESSRGFRASPPESDGVRRHRRPIAREEERRSGVARARAVVTQILQQERSKRGRERHGLDSAVLAADAC